MEDPVLGLSLLEVFEALGCEVNPKRDFRCPSPEHEDHHPSCGTYRSASGVERFKCQGCGAQGNVVDLVKLVKRCSPRDAFSWLRMTFRLEDSRLPTPLRKIDEKEYLKFVDIFLTPGSQERVGWLMVKHLEWKREKTSFKHRVTQIIRKNRTLNEQAFREKQTQEKMRRWEATGEGFPHEEIEARIRKERWGYLNTRIRRGTSVHNLEQGIRGY